MFPVKQYTLVPAIFASEKLPLWVECINVRQLLWSVPLPSSFWSDILSIYIFLSFFLDNRDWLPILVFFVVVIVCCLLCDLVMMTNNITDFSLQEIKWEVWKSTSLRRVMWPPTPLAWKWLRSHCATGSEEPRLNFWSSGFSRNIRTRVFSRLGNWQKTSLSVPRTSQCKYHTNCQTMKRLVWWQWRLRVLLQIGGAAGCRW